LAECIKHFNIISVFWWPEQSPKRPCLKCRYCQPQPEKSRTLNRWSIVFEIGFCLKTCLNVQLFKNFVDPFWWDRQSFSTLQRVKFPYNNYNLFYILQNYLYKIWTSFSEFYYNIFWQKRTLMSHLDPHTQSPDISID
jgi:hypothetical protein